MEVIYIKNHKELCIGAILLSSTAVIYALNKKYRIKKIIQTKINNAKNNFNENEVYGYWIMKKVNYWIGSINIKKDGQIIEHLFIINHKFQLIWQED